MKIEYSRKNHGFFIKNGSKKILFLKYENLFSTKANTNYKNTKISIKPKIYGAVNLIFTKMRKMLVI